MKLRDNSKALIAARIIELINANIDAGVDIEGVPFETYSEAYEAWKRDRYPQGERVNLTLTGNMLSALTHVPGEANQVVVGFSNSQAAELAYYHNISGAGRGRVLRRFLGLRDDQLEDSVLIKLIKNAIIINDLGFNL